MSQMKVTEMKNASADFISLVKRGANRIGFRVVKSEQQENVMLNLTDPTIALARAIKGEAPAAQPTGPQIIGIATLAVEGPELEAVKKSLEDNGFKVDSVETMEDGSMLFRQVEDADIAGQSLVRLSDNSVLVVKGFSPYTDDVTNDFLASVKAKGFYSSLYSATDAFRDSLYAILKDEATPTAAAAASTKLFADFQTYVKGLVADLPTKAFKMDLDMADRLAEVKVAKAEAEVAEVTAEVATDPVEGEKPAATEEPATPVVEEPVVEPVVEAAAQDPAPVEDPKSDATEQLTQVLKALGDLSSKVTEIASGQETIAQTQKSLSERVDEVARKSDDALKAVGTTVIGGAPGEDLPVRTEAVKKSDEDPRSGCFDTAFIKRT